MKKTLLLTGLIIAATFLFSRQLAAQTTETTNAPAVSEAQEMLRSNLLLQEQLHTALRAIEQSRQDADNAATKTALLFTEQLNAVKKDLATQRERDLETILSLRQSNRVALIGAAALAGVGLIALFLTAYFQIRAMNRVAEMGALFSSTLDSSRALGDGTSQTPARLNSAEQANARFLAAVEQLEKRILNLDSSAPAHDRNATLSLADISSFEPNGTRPEKSNGAAPSKVQALLDEGQVCLNEGKAEQALRSFEEALALDAKNTDALIKKGSALEALRKFQEAISAYDSAISIDSTLTVAYLYKGGVLNRLQRFNEAMECYEKALGTHPREAA
jgi:tetratricopeptide (TPR) repeat protein